MIHGTSYRGWYPASHVLLLETDQSSNYWLAENGRKGADTNFVISLGCRKTVVGVNLRNTHNNGNWDRSAKEFKILGSINENGPWEELLQESLEDSRSQNPPPVLQFIFANSASVEFIQFQLLDFWGNYGGGLQYLGIISATTTTNGRYILSTGFV